MKKVRWYYYCPVCGELSEFSVHEKLDPKLVKPKCWYCGTDFLPYTDATAFTIHDIVESQIKVEIQHSPEFEAELRRTYGIIGVYFDKCCDEYVFNLLNLSENPKYKFNPELDKFKEAYRMNSPEYSSETYEKLKQKIEIEYEKVKAINESIEQQISASSQPAPTPQQQSNQKICPNCGGTSFTPVRKNWSFLTGILTNKVDLVCNQCGQKIKA